MAQCFTTVSKQFPQFLYVSSMGGFHSSTMPQYTWLNEELKTKFCTVFLFLLCCIHIIQKPQTILFCLMWSLWVWSVIDRFWYVLWIINKMTVRLKRERKNYQQLMKHASKCTSKNGSNLFHVENIHCWGKKLDQKGPSILNKMTTVLWNMKNCICELTHLLQVLNYEIRLNGTFPREPN